MNLMALETLADLTGTDLAAHLPAGTDIVGIRPDGIILGQGDGPKLSGTLELIEPVGGESHLYVRTAGLDAVLVIVAAGRPALVEGDKFDFVLPISAMHPFESETGRRTD